MDLCPKKYNKRLIWPILFVSALSACENSTLVEGQSLDAGITRTGYIQDQKVDEASGLQSSGLADDVYFVHNDDGKPQVFAINTLGETLGSFLIDDANNRDWEDITRVPSSQGPLLLLADTGDNFARQNHVVLNFVIEPEAGNDGLYSGKYPLHHAINLTYPDGARDVESISYDPSSDNLYLLSKRDKPARLYSISLSNALNLESVELIFEGEVAQFRPADATDFAQFGKKQSQWISQPCGMDISADGKQAVVITPRSIYLFNRSDDEDWPTAFSHKPIEFIGPPSRQEEAVGYMGNGEGILITAEGLPTPVYKFRIIGPPG